LFQNSPGFSRKNRPSRSGGASYFTERVRADRMVIKHQGTQWVLYDSKGKKVLGRHPTKEKAQRQERAIQARRHG